MIDPMRFGGWNGISSSVILHVPIVIVFISADPGSIAFSLSVGSVLLPEGPAFIICQSPVQRHMGIPYFLLGHDIDLCKSGLCKFILKEIFLYLLCILQYQAHVFCLNVTLAVRYPFFFQNIGSKGQTCDRVGGSFCLRISVRIRAGICLPALFFGNQPAVRVIDGKAIFIIHCLLVLINGPCAAVLHNLNGLHQLLLSIFIRRIGNDAAIVVIDVGHSCQRVRIADAVSSGIQHKKFSCIRLPVKSQLLLSILLQSVRQAGDSLKLCQIIEIQLNRFIFHLHSIPLS